MSTVASPWEVARRPDVTVRSYAPGDAGMLGEIFHRAVHKGNHGAYTDAPPGRRVCRLVRTGSST